MPEYERPYPHLLDEIDRLRARLAAVEALATGPHVCQAVSSATRCVVCQVRAALRGEDT